MSKKNALPSRRQVTRPQVIRPLPRLPHPSWRQALAGGDGERSNVSADDFWSRLGL